MAGRGNRLFVDEDRRDAIFSIFYRPLITTNGIIGTIKFMKIFKKWWFWVGLIIVVGIGAFFLVPKPEPVQFVTEVIETKDLTQTVDASGEVVSVDEVELSFDISGTVDQLLVAVGDAVEPTALLAVLDTTVLIADVQSAFQANQVAQANLDQQKAGSADETIAVSQASAKAAEASFWAADTDLEHIELLYELSLERYGLDTQSAEISLTTAQDNYNQTVADNAEMLSDAYDDLLSAAWAAVIEARSGLLKADEILGVRNGTMNDDYESVLSAKDAEALTFATTTYVSAESALETAEAAMTSVDYGSSSGEIVNAADAVAEAIGDVTRLMLYVRQVVGATLTASGFTASELTALIADVNATSSAVQVDHAALENAFQTLSDALSTSSANLEDALNALDAAQTTLDSTEVIESYQVQLSQQSLDAAEALLEIRQADYDRALASLSEVQASPRTVDLASFEAEVERTRAAYQAAQARLEKAQISSPIAGIVTEVGIETGEQVVAATPVITVQTTGEQFEIIADVSESDIARVELNDVAEMTFDAFSNDIEFKGFISEIDPAEKLIEGVVYYEVTVNLESAEQGVSLRPGMSADLTIYTDSRSGVLTLPQRAVLQENEMRYVRVLVNGEVERREVTTGLRGDLGRIEIVSGVQEGDEIVIREVENE